MSAGELLRATLAGGSPYPTAAGDAVRPNMVASDDPTPYIAFIRTGNDRELGLGGVLLAKTETFNVFCWADTPEEAQALEEEVIALLLAAGFGSAPNEADGDAPEVSANCAVLTVIYITTPPIT